MTWTLEPLAVELVLKWTWNQVNREVTCPWCLSSNMTHGTQTSKDTWLIRMLQLINKHSFTKNIWMISQWGSKKRKRRLKRQIDWKRRIVAYRPSNKLNSNVCTRMKSKTPTKAFSTVKWTNKEWTSRLNWLKRQTWQEWINKGWKCRDSRIAKCARWKWCNKMSTETSSMDRKLREVLDFNLSLVTYLGTSNKPSCVQDRVHQIQLLLGLTKAKVLVSNLTIQ